MLTRPQPIPSKWNSLVQKKSHICFKGNIYIVVALSVEENGALKIPKMFG
jgi:hypothetical protein